MAAITNNIYDMFNWVGKVIDSCETLDHINSAERLVERFRIQTSDHNLYFKLYGKISFKLQSMKKNKK
jgi:hypothetical protein